MHLISIKVIKFGIKLKDDLQPNQLMIIYRNQMFRVNFHYFYFNSFIVAILLIKEKHFQIKFYFFFLFFRDIFIMN
jgi:hypothetical protein